MLEDFYDYSTVVSNDRKTVIDKSDITRLVSESLFLYYKEIEETLGTPDISFPEKEIYAFASDKELIDKMGGTVNVYSFEDDMFGILIELEMCNA